MKTIKKVVITNEEWRILNDTVELLDAWFREAPEEDCKAIEEMFETIGEKYDGYSYMTLIRKVLDEVCDEIDVED